MQYEYAPWRYDYVSKKVDGCVFCHISKNPSLDEENQVLYRDKYCFVVMNKYPYTPGHFMVIPHFHIDNLENLDTKIWLNISSIVQKSVRMLREGFNTKAVNIGMNLGEDAGAGISEHIHYHIVPRWGRDTNFITTIANTRIYSVDFNKVYKKLKILSQKYLLEN